MPELRSAGTRCSRTGVTINKTDSCGMHGMGCFPRQTAHAERPRPTQILRVLRKHVTGQRHTQSDRRDSGASRFSDAAAVVASGGGFRSTRSVQTDGRLKIVRLVSPCVDVAVPTTRWLYAGHRGHIHSTPPWRWCSRVSVRRDVGRPHAVRPAPTAAGRGWAVALWP